MRGSNPLPPRSFIKPPPPPPPPPARIVGFFGETRESVQARRDYEIYMAGWSAGLKVGRGQE
jgi:hypothetical protein